MHLFSPLPFLWTMDRYWARADAELIFPPGIRESRKKKNNFPPRNVTFWGDKIQRKKNSREISAA